MKKKVLVGMSGGVDSSVAAAMLIEQGYEVTGVFVEAYNESGCRTDQDKKDALQVALSLGISFEVVDLRREYKERVVKYFLDEYKSGRTPNPDIICNRDIKFGLLYDYMEQRGYDFLATGHYARIAKKELLLQRPKDFSKDQTYFLWQVAGKKLEKILFPLGEMLKSEVRARARILGLSNADKPDSMGVCMLGELDMREFLKNKIGTEPGDVIYKGERIGRHQGIWFTTIGERGGWKTNAKIKSQKSKIDLTNLPPLYVIAKDVENNRLYVGTREEGYATSMLIDGTLYIDPVPSELWVRIRNLGELVRVSKWGIEQGSRLTKVALSEAVFAPAPGQSAVFYDQDGRVLGGGLIA